MLCRRHFDIGDDHSCLLCPSVDLGTSLHLFFTCTFSVSCWNILHIIWDTTLPMQEMFDAAATAWPHALFKEVTIMAAWNIWKIRNYFDRVPASLTGWLRSGHTEIEGCS